MMVKLTTGDQTHYVDLTRVRVIVNSKRSSATIYWFGCPGHELVIDDAENLVKLQSALDVMCDPRRDSRFGRATSRARV